MAGDADDREEVAEDLAPEEQDEDDCCDEEQQPDGTQTPAADGMHRLAAARSWLNAGAIHDAHRFVTTGSVVPDLCHASWRTMRLGRYLILVEMRPRCRPGVLRPCELRAVASS